MLGDQLTWMFLSGAFAVVLCIVVELIGPTERIRWKSRFWGAVHTAIITASIGVSLFLFSRFQHWLGLKPILPPIEQWAGIFAVPVAILFADFLKYWEHRFEHRFYWQVHKVHHAVRELHAANNIGHPLHALPLLAFYYLPMSLLNFQSVVTPMAAVLAIKVVNNYTHSPVAYHFGWLRHLLIDNRFHRIHHSLDARHFDRNFGVIFSVWDRMFGTAYFPKEGEWPAIGVEGEDAPRGIGHFLAMPFRKPDVKASLPSPALQARDELPATQHG